MAILRPNSEIPCFIISIVSDRHRRERGRGELLAEHRGRRHSLLAEEKKRETSAVGDRSEGQRHWLLAEGKKRETSAVGDRSEGQLLPAVRAEGRGRCLAPAYGRDRPSSFEATRHQSMDHDWCYTILLRRYLPWMSPGL